mmetsp:Transcript_27538/g.107874  ORF Transcript_27538/g.107874 Transcript_27538/m.107874 type:complete len:84 (-) Transcript_27538:470-721(-)
MEGCVACIDFLPCFESLCAGLRATGRLLEDVPATVGHTSRKTRRAVFVLFSSQLSLLHSKPSKSEKRGKLNKVYIVAGNCELR